MSDELSNPFDVLGFHAAPPSQPFDFLLPNVIENRVYKSVAINPRRLHFSQLRFYRM